MEPVGYVSLVIDGLRQAGVEAKAIGAGIPGDTSSGMLARLPGLLALKPDWLLVSCGVNDVYRPPGVPLDLFRRNMAEIVTQAQAAGIRVMLLTATLLSETPEGPHNRTLARYNAAVRELAVARKCLLADVATDMVRTLTALEQAGEKRGHLLTTEGAHLNGRGNATMAEGVLRAFGMDAATLARAKAAWSDIPGAANVCVPLTLRQLEALTARATGQHTTVQRLLQPGLEKSVAEFLAR
jgi:lysophospholipase L1-like esterase